MIKQNAASLRGGGVSVCPDAAFSADVRRCDVWISLGERQLRSTRCLAADPPPEVIRGRIGSPEIVIPVALRRSGSDHLPFRNAALGLVRFCFRHVLPADSPAAFEPSRVAPTHLRTCATNNQPENL